ncbi:hypothetical protein D3C84_758930 [compost metagenome]
MVAPWRVAMPSSRKSSTDSSLPATRTDSSLRWLLTWPAGKSRLAAAMASATSLTDSPSASSRYGCSSMRISRLLAPTSFTSPTPLTVCSRFFSTLSSQLLSSRCEPSCWLKVYDISGSSLGFICEMVGVLTSRRSRPCAAPTLSRTSCRPMAGSVDSSNSTTSVATPSEE